MKDGVVKGIIIVLLTAIAGLLVMVLFKQNEPEHIYYESTPGAATSELVAFSPPLDLDHGSIYWIADLAEGALPFVVNIQTTIDISNEQEDGQRAPRDLFEEFNFGPDGDNSPFQFRQFEFPQNHPPVGGEGSGFIFREDGYIVTNAHVVAGADKYSVSLHDGTVHEAELVGTDVFKDIAVLKIDGNELPSATLADSDKLRIGEPVVAIGSPVGFDGTVTAGIVSTNHRSVEDMGRPGDVRGNNIYIQTDAAINRGNSGGPLLNANGEVVGINQAITRWDNRDSVPVEGIGFTIPINAVKESITSIVQHGKVVYPGISAVISSVEDFLSSNENVELKVDRGVYISSITKGGPADQAGLVPGDVILDINGADVNTGEELISEIQRYEVGERVILTVARQGMERQEAVSVVLGELDVSGIGFGD